MRKLIILMFVALGAISAMAATDYGIKVNGTSITSDNLRFTIGSGGVAYDESSNTLTLSSVSITRTGSGNHALRVYTNSNRSTSELTINISGTSTLIAGNADAVVLDATTKFVVMGSSSVTIGTAASGQYAVRVYNNADVEFHGPGSLTITASDGVAVKGEGGNEYARFYIKNCTLQGKRGNFVKLGRVSIYPYNSSLTQSTTITLSPTKSSSYPHTQNVSSYYYGDNVHLASPEGASFPDLATASNYSKTYVFNDEHDNPNLTTVGNFQYDTYTLNGETYARLRNPTVAFRHTYPSYIEIPGYVTLNGTMRHVMVGTEAFRDMNSVTSIRMYYGVGAISNVAFRFLPNLSSVFIPSSVKSIGNTFLSECGASATNGTLSVFWATLDPSAVSLGDNAFYACHADTRRVVLPTLPAISKANYITKITQNFTVSSTPSPRSSCDIYTGNSTTSGYGYIVTTPGSSSVQPKAALVHSDFAHVVINNNFIGYDGYLGLYIYCDNVAEQAFKYNTNVDALTVSNSDVTINKEAFYGCTSLTSATLNAKLIKEDAFAGCTSLSTVTLNEGVQQIYSRAFERATMTTLNIPSTLNMIAVTSVNNCNNLAKFTVASGNSYYSTYGTYGWLFDKAQTTLVKVPPYCNGVAAYPTTLTTINDYAFSDNQRLDYVDIPYGVTLLGATTSAEGGRIFMNSRIKVVKIPSSVTRINYTNTFYGCTNLKKILISTYANRSSVTSTTFYNVPSSLTVYVPSWWDTEAENTSAAYYTDAIWKNYNVTYGAWDVVVNGFPYFLNTWTEGGMKTAYLVRGTNINYGASDYNMLKSGALTIPETFTYNGTTYMNYGIASYAFEGNTQITSLTLSSYLMGGGCQFRNCTGLLQLNVTPQSQTTIIPKECFRNTRLNDVTLPYGVETVSGLAFADNPNLERILVPSSCYHNGFAQVSSNFVRNCSKLKSIHLNIVNPTYMNNDLVWPAISDVAPENSTNGCFYNVPRTCKVYVPVGSLTRYKTYQSSNGHKIWNYFNSIENGAYDYDFPGRGYVTFTGDVLTDQNSTKMLAAKYVYVPGDTTTVARLGVNYYGTYDYRVVALSDSCFANQDYLKEVNINWNKVTMTEIPDNAFRHCNNLKKFSWPTIATNVNRVGVNAFMNAPLTGTADMGNFLGSGFRLENYAFQSANSISAFILPSTTTYVGNMSMMQNNANTTFTCYATSVPSCGSSNPWNSSLQPSQTLYVPQSSISAYSAATYWKNFGRKLPATGGVLGDLNGDGFVNTGDVSVLYQAIVSGSTDALYDLNGDGNVNTGDVSMLYSLIIGS